MAEVIEIRIRQTGARTVSRDISNIGAAAERSSRSIDLARRALGGFGAALVARQVLRTADSFQLLENRVRVFTNSAAEANARVEDLVDIAVRTRTPLDGIATVFQRFSLVTQDAGISSETTAGLIENLSKAVAISGATSQEAEGALRQLSQGFAANRLSGQEFNSVAEQIPIVAKLIAEELGVGVDQLRAMVKASSEAGETLITQDVIQRALSNSTEELNRLFALIVPTIGQGATALATGFTRLVGEFSKVTGLGERLARTLQGIGIRFVEFARDGDRVRETAQRVSNVIRGLAVAVLPLLVRQLVLAGIAARETAKRLLVLAAANPFTAIAVALTAAVGLAIAFKDEVFAIGGTETTLSDIASIIGEDITSGFRFAADNANALLSTIFDVDDAFTTLQNVGKAAFNTLVSGFNIVGRVGFEVAETLIRVFGGFFLGLGSSILSIPRALKAAATGDFSEAGRVLGDAFFAAAGEGASNFVSDVRTIIEEELAFNAFDTVSNAVNNSSIIDRAGARTQARGLSNAVDDLIRNNPELFGGGGSSGGGGGRPPGLSGIELDLLEKEFRELQTSLDPALARTKEFADAQLLLAQLLNGGRISLEEYNGTLGQVTQKLRDEALQDFRALQAELNPQVEVLQTYQDRLSILKTALDDGSISQEQFRENVKLTTEAFVEGIQELEDFSDLTGLDAFRQGFSESLKQLVEDAGSQTEILRDGFIGVFGEIGNAIKGVFTGAEFDARQFASNIVGEISKVVTQLIVLQLAQAALGGGGLGGGGGSVGGFFSQLLGLAGSRQSGGTVNAGKSFLVGERGPEIFTPPRTGEVIPNDQLGAALNPSVNVQVVNVDDPSSTLNAMSTREGEQVILNTIQRNSGKLRPVLA